MNISLDNIYKIRYNLTFIIAPVLQFVNKFPKILQ